MIPQLAVGFIGQLNTAQIGALTTAQVAKLTATQLGILNKTQAASLSGAQLTALGSNVQYLAGQSVAGMSIDNLRLIYGQLTTTQLAALSADQLNALKQGGNAQTDLLLSLTTAGIRNEVNQIISSGKSIFTYDSVLKILQAVNTNIGSQGLTQTQLNELKVFVQAIGKVADVNSYLYEIASNVVNGNKSNAYWTGGQTTRVAMGNLGVGSSVWLMDKLIDKWFLGEDLPTWTSSAYATINSPLYSASGPLASDVRQGGIGDCYLLAAMVSVANVESALIKSMITDNGNGTYGIRFYGTGDDPLYVTVNNQLPSSGRATSVSGGNWVSLLEKAYVEYEVQMYNELNSYAGIEGGWGSGLTAITGKNLTTHYSYSSTLATWTSTIKNNVINALNNKQEVMYASFLNVKDPTNGLTDLVSGHMYSVLGYNSAKDTILLRNPWGDAGGSSWNGKFELSMSQLWGGTDTATSARYSGFLYANEASPAGAINPKYATSQLVQAMASTNVTASAQTSTTSSNATGLMPPLLLASAA